MNTLTKRIIFESKQTFIIFAIIFSLIFILYLGVSLGDFRLIDAFMILSYVSIGVAFISSMIRYSFLLSQKRNIFEYQGLTNKKYNHLVVILSEVFAYIIFDIIILIIFYSFNIEALIKQEEYGSFYLLDNIYNLLFFKYLITVAVYTLFNISYSFKQYFTTIAGAILCMAYLFQLATAHILFNVLFIVIMLVLNIYIYQIKMKQHNKTTLELISYSFIMVFVMLFIKDFVFVPIVMDSSFRFIDIGKYSINVLPIIGVIIWTIFISKRLYNKFFLPKVIFIGLIIPFIVAAAATQIINISQNKVDMVYIDDEWRNTISIRNFGAGQHYEDGTISLSNLDPSKRSQLFNSLSDNAVYQYNRDIYDIHSKYMIENNLVFINHYGNSKNNNLVLNRDKFDEIIKEAGIERIYFYIEYMYQTDSKNIVVLNDNLQEYEDIIKNNLQNYYDINEFKFIIDNDLFEQLGLVNPQVFEYNDDFNEVVDDIIYKRSIYLLDKQSIGNDTQYIGKSQEIKSSFEKEGE